MQFEVAAAKDKNREFDIQMMRRIPTLIFFSTGVDDLVPRKRLRCGEFDTGSRAKKFAFEIGCFFWF